MTKELSDEKIEAGWHQTFSTNNPFCPCDLKSFTKAVKWAERNLAATASPVYLAAPMQPGAAADDRVQAASTGKLIGFVSLESAERPMVSDPSTGPSWGSYSRQAFGEWSVPVYVDLGAAADDARDAAEAPDEDERSHLAETLAQLEADGQTTADYETLMDWAQQGFLRCKYFEITPEGWEAIAPAAKPADTP